MFKKNSFIGNIALVSGFSLLTKVIGFLREVLIARIYGRNWITDAFFLSQNMPSLIFPAVCDSFAVAFTSIYKKKRKKRKIFFTYSIIFLGFISLCLTIISIILIPKIIFLLTPGFDEKTTILAVKLSTISMSYFTIIMLNTIFIALLNSEKKFLKSQLSWLFYNSLIVIIMLFFSESNIYYLTFSYFLSNFLQLFYLIYMVKFSFLFPNEKFLFIRIFKSKSILRMLRLAIPIMIGNSIHQLQNIIDKTIVSYGKEGSLSSLSYSISINSITIGLIIFSIITVFYPDLLDTLKKKNYIELEKKIELSINLLTIIILPITIYTYYYSENIVRAIYGKGNFDLVSIKETSKFLKYYSLGYLFIGTKEMLIKIFYGLENSKIPMINSIISISLNIFLSISISSYIGVYGVALGTSIATLVSSAILIFYLQKYYSYVKIKFNFFDFFKNVMSIGISLYIIYEYKVDIFEENYFLKTFVEATSFFLIYILILFIFGHSIFKNILKKSLSNDVD
ncbi:putative lipid II flippase MurJ [Fusobacterium necrophorum]|nr:murein biosynthesis integral membrane protein MurJ [Fusobacterium necrophorum]MBR8823454.1 putative lipid II flippase MurJ [Fusobacterium necrophorum]